MTRKRQSGFRKRLPKTSSTSMIDGYLGKEAMKTTSGYVGASGEISFGATGEPKKTIHVNMIQDGAFVTVYTVN